MQFATDFTNGASPVVGRMQGRQTLPVPALRHLMLTCLRVTGPLTAYALIRGIEDITGGRVRIATPTLYENLKRLREAGMVERSAVNGRGVYAITASGIDAAIAEDQLRRDLLKLTEPPGT